MCLNIDYNEIYSLESCNAWFHVHCDPKTFLHSSWEDSRHTGIQKKRKSDKPQTELTIGMFHYGITLFASIVVSAEYMAQPRDITQHDMQQGYNVHTSKVTDRTEVFES